MTALELLAARQRLEISPFVAAWDGAIATFDRQPVSDRDVKRAVENVLSASPWAGGDLLRVIESVAHGSSSGAAYRSALQHSAKALISILSAVGDTSYLSPILDLARPHPGFFVATLNYDRTIELEGQRIGVDVDTGVSRWAETGSWQWSPGERGLRLLKLHGSIDWRFAPSTDSALPELRLLADGVHSPQAEPGVIFGGANKLRAAGPYLDLLRAWEEQLARTNAIAIVGYSFRDDHVNEILRRWINRSDDRRVVIVNPSASQPWDHQPKFVREMINGLAGHMARETKSAEVGLPNRPHRLISLHFSASQGIPHAIRLLSGEHEDVWATPTELNKRAELASRLDAVLRTGDN